MEKIKKFFDLDGRKTSFSVELIAGITTFMTMAYVLVVQPSAIVGFAGNSVVDVNGVMISKEAIVITCPLISALITILMGLYANLPFALSCGMGSNFMFGALIQSGSLSFAQAMTMTLVSGIVFVLLTIFGIRDVIVMMMPKNIKIAIGTAIGFFIAYLGFDNTGIGSFVDGIGMGNFKDPAVVLAILGLVIIAILTAYKVKGAILIGVVVITLLGIPFGVTTVPDSLILVPDFSTVENVVFQLDFTSIWTAEGLVLMFIAFFGDFFSTLGTVLGVAKKANMLDENGNLEGIEKPFLVDAIGTCVGALTDCTTVTTFVESTSGVEAGGRTGLSSIVVGALFFLMTFFSPLVLMIPNAATGPALIFVGFIMIQGFKDIDFSDFTEAIGPFVMIMFTTFMGSIAAGIAAGILAYVIVKVATGKFSDVHV